MDVLQETKGVSFGCCAYWQSCEMGKKDCVYALNNPSKMNRCGAYKREQRIQTQSQLPQVVESITVPKATLDLPKEEPTSLQANDDGQLSLF